MPGLGNSLNIQKKNKLMHMLLRSSEEYEYR